MRLEPRPLSTGDLTNLELEGAEKEVNWAANESLISLLVQCSIYTVAAYLHGLLIIIVTPYAACLHVLCVLSSSEAGPGPGTSPVAWVSGHQSAEAGTQSLASDISEEISEARGADYTVCWHADSWISAKVISSKAHSIVIFIDIHVTCLVRKQNNAKKWIFMG